MRKEMMFVSAILISSQLTAQNDSSSYKSLDEVVHTANKYPQKQSTTGKVLTVISRQTLEQNYARTLTQVLNEQAGVVINGSQNALGTNQTVFMRGATTANTLILVDGVPANVKQHHLNEQTGQKALVALGIPADGDRAVLLRGRLQRRP